MFAPLALGFNTYMAQSAKLERTAWRESLERDGCVILREVFSTAEVAAFRDGLAAAFEQAQREGEALRDRSGAVFGGRNILQLYPPANSVWQIPVLQAVLRDVVGPGAGLVRALYFDKPPARTWALPWHQDWTIAVQQHLPSRIFTKPTTKAGVPHVEAPRDLLESMLTLRIHLDDMTPANGPLQVVPGSHRTLESAPRDEAMIRTIELQSGDVFVMRPLLTHCSLPGLPGNTAHRRTLHLEFAGRAELPDGFRWQQFVPLT